jgi:nicotinate dehydrogenase subunit A
VQASIARQSKRSHAHVSRLSQQLIGHTLSRKFWALRLRATGQNLRDRMQITFTVNGEPRNIAADEDTPLLAVLRNLLGLRSARFGCGHEQCGACMVLIDGKPAYSCTRPVSTVNGKSIVTVEGLGTAERPHPLQQAILEEQAGQCGYCLSGIMVSAKALLDGNPQPSRLEIAAALDPHLCRCGIQLRIIAAVERAAAALWQERGA